MSDKGMSVFAVNADAHDVFSKVAAAAGLPLIIDDTVQGNITINIVNKQPKDIIALLVDAYGFSFSEVNKVYVVSEGVPKKPSSYMLGEIEAVTTKYVQPARARSLLPIFLQSDVKMNTDQNASGASQALRTCGLYRLLEPLKYPSSAPLSHTRSQRGRWGNIRVLQSFSGVLNQAAHPMIDIRLMMKSCVAMVHERTSIR